MKQTHVGLLINALGDPREGVRQLAMNRLLLAGKNVIPALIEKLASNDDYIRESIASLLTTIGDDSIPFLIVAMRHQNRNIAWESSMLLAEMGPATREALETACCVA